MAGMDELGLIFAQAAVEESENLDLHRVSRPQINCFELPERNFVKLFRVNKSMADEIISSVNPFMRHGSISSALSTTEKVLVALRFFAAGSYQQDVGQNFNLHVSQSSVSRSIHEVIDASHESNFFEEHVKFHENLSSLNMTAQRYYNKFRFPGVIGSIDCTHVAIVPPKKEDEKYPEHIYVNRKGYHSINVQLICDTELKILSVNARFPGSVDDSFIWNCCNVRPVMEQLNDRYPGTYFLLGDSGYALRPWMLTPISNAENTTPEGRYNISQMSARSVIERLNGVLKMRFRCLLKHRVLHYTPVTASKIINVCCALNNMCRDNALEDVPPVDDDDIMDGVFFSEETDVATSTTPNPLLAQGRLVQRQIVTRYFA